jgi:hypothetical protein
MPLHPSWPDAFGLQRGVSLARSGRSTWTPDQYYQEFSAPTTQCRSLAPLWRPYTTDNIAGPTWAREIFADKLAAHLAEKYGADPQVVQQKIDSLTFDYRFLILSPAPLITIEVAPYRFTRC